MKVVDWIKDTSILYSQKHAYGLTAAFEGTVEGKHFQTKTVLRVSEILVEMIIYNSANWQKAEIDHNVTNQCRSTRTCTKQ